MATFNEQQIETARQTPIHLVLGLQANGRNVSVRCVFHQDRTPSLTIYANGGYHCFGCGANGQNAVDFVMGMGYSFTESVRYLLVDVNGLTVV